jgi:FMN phosphatase YigB (HAD superfamily)
MNKKVAVGFDFDRTLGVDNGLERRALGMLAEFLGAPLDVHDGVVIERLEDVLRPFRNAEISMETMVAGFVASLALPPAEDRDHAALTERYREICYALVDDLVEPIDGARSLLDALIASGVAIGILTNGWSPLQELKIARALGAFPGPVLVSDTIGAYKPAGDAFAYLEGALNCSEDELWYVGDNPSVDVGGARARGLRAIWFDRGESSYPPDLAPPDARVERLADVLTIVRGA